MSSLDLLPPSASGTAASAAAASPYYITSSRPSEAALSHARVPQSEEISVTSIPSCAWPTSLTMDLPLALVASDDPGIVEVLLLLADGSTQSFEVTKSDDPEEFQRNLKREMALRNLGLSEFQPFDTALYPELLDGSRFQAFTQIGQATTGDTRLTWLPSWGDIFGRHVPWCLVLALGVYNVGVWERQWQPEQ